MNQTKISYKRHIAKTISYRIISTGIGFLAMWWVSGNVKIGAAFGLVELLYKPIQYYTHERIWYKWIKFGIIIKAEKNRNHKISAVEESENLKQIKVPEDNLPTQPIKKVLNYNSNR